MGQIGLKRRRVPHPLNGEGKERWMYLSTRGKVRLSLTCLRKDELLRVKEGALRNMRAGISHQGGGEEAYQKQTDRSVLGDSGFVEGRCSRCKLSHILNLFCYCSFTPLDLN